MPAGPAAIRSDQSALLDRMCQEILTDPAVGDLLDTAEADPDRSGPDGAPLDPWQRANLKEMRRCWRHATAVPPDLMEATSRASRVCEMVWREARPAADHGHVPPSLVEVLSLTREGAAVKVEAFGVTPLRRPARQPRARRRSARVDTLFEPWPPPCPI